MSANMGIFCARQEGKVFANVMSLSLGRGGRVTQSRVPDIGFHEIRGEDGGEGVSG